MYRDLENGYNADQLLLEGLARHEEVALEILYRRYYPVALQLVMNNSGTEDDAKDIFQEALLVLYEKAADPSFGLQCKLKTFLYSVCRHLWLKKLHQQQRQVRLTAETEAFIPVEDEIERQEEMEWQFRQMNRALEALGEPCRTLLEDYYLRKLSMSVIAEKFHYTGTDNAKNQKYKCLMRLKKLFFLHYKKETHDERSHKPSA